MKKTTHYDLGIIMATVEQRESGIIKVTIKENRGNGNKWVSNFRTLQAAYKEILSYAEVDDDYQTGA